MAAKTLAAIRQIVRQLLRDEFDSGIVQEWEDDELDIHIQNCLDEISEYSPRIVKETLATTEDSKDLDISDIEDLLHVERLEYEVDEDPKQYRNFSIMGDTLTMVIDTAPSEDDEDVYLYCAKPHLLTEATSTLKLQHERRLILGVLAKATIAIARKHINTVNVGGGRTAKDMESWGLSKLAEYRAELDRIAEDKTYIEYPKG